MASSCAKQASFSRSFSILSPLFHSYLSHSSSSSFLMLYPTSDGRRSARRKSFPTFRIKSDLGPAAKRILKEVCKLSTEFAATRFGKNVNGGKWREVVDPASGKPYFWNMETNETKWECPDELENPATVPESATSMAKVCCPQMASQELLKILLDADPYYFADVANKYRPQCFENEFFEFLNGAINSTMDANYREALEKLRARLANPLLKNPPPY